MGEVDLQHDAADTDRRVVGTRRGMCEACRYNRGTQHTPVCNGPLLNGRGIAPCTLSRMWRSESAECYHDDASWRADWKRAALSDADGCAPPDVRSVGVAKAGDQTPRLIVPRSREQRGRNVVLNIWQN